MLPTMPLVELEFGDIWLCRLNAVSSQGAAQPNRSPTAGWQVEELRGKSTRDRLD